MLKDLNIFVCKIFPLFTLKCVSYDFLSLPSRKFNVEERLIYTGDSEIEVTLVLSFLLHRCKETVSWIDSQQDSKKQASISIKVH